MTAAADSRKLMWEALGASLGVHLLIAIFLPALAWTVAATDPVETISFVRVSHIRIEPRPRPVQPQPRAAAPHRSEEVHVTFASRVELSHQRKRNASPPPAIPKLDSVAPTVASVSKAGAATGTNGAGAVPQPTATPAQRAVASVPGRQTGGYLPFGASQPDPVLDPAIRKQLTDLGVHTTLVVVVDEDGHTKSVQFQPPVDPALQGRIQSLLADASWDPAVCGGGVACEGTATIKL